MSLEIEKQWWLHYAREAGDMGTNRWDKKGVGDGQRALAAEKKRLPDAEITLRTREVVMTPWKKEQPDPPCPRGGMAHAAHGDCPGSSRDYT